MKRIYLLIILNILFLNVGASIIPIKEIKDSILLFLKQTKDMPENSTIDYLPNKIIIDRKDKSHIQDQKNGIFYIPSFSAHGYAHYLLVDNMSFQIINMREPIEVNLEKVIKYLKKNENLYSKSDIFFYLLDIIKTDEKNKIRSQKPGIYIDID
ncbi:hypothetical protein GGR21_004292 [Dysgonomonas hofstadii]|uniref:Uncharacterized protein n=1 Tax=Dysgonomonas hofstadii TaxID=637886 RepID=A0A840D1Y1_9BACT|nr:hypothetical protein [Dysgonomonas hofstadii]MBB4038353.1 hypothetical protein [Dysgonomonas hofstadii]